MKQCVGPAMSVTLPTLYQGCERQGPWVHQRVRCTGAVELGQDLSQLRVEEIMNREHIAEDFGVEGRGAFGVMVVLTMCAAMVFGPRRL